MDPDEIDSFFLILVQNKCALFYKMPEQDGQFHPLQLLHSGAASDSFDNENVLKCIDLHIFFQSFTGSHPSTTITWGGEPPPLTFPPLSRIPWLRSNATC